METAGVIEERRIDGRPLTTYAQFVAELETASPNAGFVRVPVNMTSLVGGAHRFFGPVRGKDREARLEACRIFKDTYEQSQIGGARAVDPSVEPVDGGGANPDCALMQGLSARQKWGEITDGMSRVELRHLTFVIVGEWGPTAYAKFAYGVRKANASQIGKGMVEFRRMVDKLGVVLKLQSRGTAHEPA